MSSIASISHKSPGLCPHTLAEAALQVSPEAGGWKTFCVFWEMVSMGHRPYWILEQISAFGVGGDVGAAFEKKKNVKGWRRYAVAKERSSRRNMGWAWGLGRRLKEGEKGLHLGAQREKAGKRPTPCSAGRVPILGRKRKMRKTKNRQESGPGGGRMWSRSSEWE